MDHPAIIRTRFSKEQLDKMLNQDFTNQLHNSFDTKDCFELLHENDQYKIKTDYSSLNMFNNTIIIFDEGEGCAIHFSYRFDIKSLFRTISSVVLLCPIFLIITFSFEALSSYYLFLQWPMLHQIILAILQACTAICLLSIPFILCTVTFHFLMEFTLQRRSKIKNVLIEFVQGDLWKLDESNEVVRKLD